MRKSEKTINEIEHVIKSWTYGTRYACWLSSVSFGTILACCLDLIVDNENELEVQILLINTLQIDLYLLSKQLAIKNERDNNVAKIISSNFVN